LALLLLLGLRGGDGGEHPPPAPPAARSKEPDPVTRAEWWFEEAIDGVGTPAGSRAEELRSVLAVARERGYDKLAGFDWPAKQLRVHELLLRIDPDDPDANRAFGRIPLSDYPDFWGILRRLFDARTLPDELDRFRRSYEAKVSFRKDEAGNRRVPCVPQEEYAGVVRALDAFLEHERKLAADPTLAAVLDALQRVKRDPLLGSYETVHIVEGPFVVFFASKELAPRDGSPNELERVESKRAAMRKRLEPRARLLRDFLAFFRERWMKPMELPEFPERQLFFVWAFEDREAFDAYGEQLGQRHPPGLKGYFNPRDAWVFVFEDPDSTMSVETALAHELVHQLHWHFSKDPQGQFKNHFERLAAVWFSEGWAEYVGWHDVKDGGHLFGADSRSRMTSLHAFRRVGLPLPPPRFLVQRRDYLEWIHHMRKWLAERPQPLPDSARAAAQDPGTLLEGLYAQSWLFVKFLHESEGGRYRAPVLEFTRAALRGFPGFTGEKGYPTAAEVFAKVFALATDDDWKRLERDFEKFVEAKLYEVPPDAGR
ncbi:MAG: hypothetical protein ACREID_09875, partial [Planctomycetota bacterium]